MGRDRGVSRGDAQGVQPALKPSITSPDVSSFLAIDASLSGGEDGPYVAALDFVDGDEFEGGGRIRGPGRRKSEFEKNSWFLRASLEG